MGSTYKQIPRRKTFLKQQIEFKNKRGVESRKFDYSLNYKKLDLRALPNLYRVGVGEQGVLLVEPYKSEILPHWRFATPDVATKSAKEIVRLFRTYRKARDFVGVDMARKFLQMGFTRSRRYANHRSGRKYGPRGNLLPLQKDLIKAQSAAIFLKAWKRVEGDVLYKSLKLKHKAKYG